MASLAEKPTSDKGIKTNVQECGNSITWQAFRLGQKADTISCFFSYDRGTRRFTGGMRVPEGQSVPDVDQLFTILLNGRDGVESASSEYQATTSAPNRIEAESSDKSALMEAAAAPCRSQPTSAVDSPKTKLLDESSYRATRETGVMSDVSVHKQGEPGSPLLASMTMTRRQTATSGTCLSSRTQQQGLSTVGDAVQASVPGGQSGSPHNEASTRRILKANNQSGRVRKVLSPTDVRREKIRHFFFEIGKNVRLMKEDGYRKSMPNTGSAAATSATRQMNQQVWNGAALAGVSQGPASTARSVRGLEGKLNAPPAAGHSRHSL